MKSLVLFSVCLFLTVNVYGNPCGGLLEGEQGHFSIANASKQAQSENTSSSCLWIIQLHYENNIRFTLGALSKDALLNLYPEDQLLSSSLTDYMELNSTQVESSFEFLGKTLIVILPNSSASVSFSWHYIGNVGENSSVAIMKNSDYINSPNGLLEWEQLKRLERVTWGINPNEIFSIKWDVDVVTSCDSIDSCTCFGFAVFQLTSAGVLSEAVRICDQSSEGKLEGIFGLAVVLVKVNTKIDANRVAVSWDDLKVTEPPTTVLPPKPIPYGLFAATETGLVALNLQTLEATFLTSTRTDAVAVNQHLEKVYWSESESAGNCRLMRSDFNGYAPEVIVPPRGGAIFALAVHEPSGNVYFNVWYSNEITVCNELGKNCTEVISSSSLAGYPWSLALDSANDVMYWSNYEFETSIIRANLDGSNVTTISSGFSTSSGITLALPSSDTLYWTDPKDNTIGIIDVNGSNKRTLVELESNPAPWGIQVDADKIYFGSFYGKIIQSLDRDSGKELITIFNSTGGIRNLVLFSASA